MSEAALPASWAKVRLNELARARMGKTILKSDLTETGIPVYSAGASTEPWGFLEGCEVSFGPETLVISARGNIGMPKQPRRFPFVCTQTTIACSAYDPEIVSWIFWFLNQYDYSEKTSQTTIPMLRTSDVDSFDVPLPPLAEQKRIVAKIEELFSELEAGEASLRKARRQLGVYRQSLLKQAFEGKLTQKWRTQNPRNISSAWREVEVTEVLTSKPTNGRSVKDRTGGFRVLRLTAIKNGVINLRENKEGDWDAADAATHVVRKGNFLLSRGNGSIHLVGRGGIVREDADVAFPDTMIRLPLDLSLVDPLFFSYVWNSRQVREQIESSARTTAGIYKINQALLTRYRVPLCSLPEQQEIVRILDSQFEAIERNERELDAALKRSEALRQAILKKAFSGRLVPQHPTDEPASVLLARLRTERASMPSIKRKSSLP